VPAIEPFGYRQVTTDTLSPVQIVENAREYIKQNLSQTLNIAKVAKGIGVTMQDLRGSFNCVTPTTFEMELRKIRMNALYEAIRANPSTSLDLHISSVGLEDIASAASIFEEEFWITLDEYQENCMGLNWIRSQR